MAAEPDSELAGKQHNSFDWRSLGLLCFTTRRTGSEVAGASEAASNLHRLGEPWPAVVGARAVHGVNRNRQNKLLKWHSIHAPAGKSDRKS